ncbi:MAG: ABC transporter ATP-binding protein [Phycisphaeraceae bacterium]|nr:ABC transporter ATP-binding protein [Phycisphaeraceae bacterium]
MSEKPSNATVAPPSAANDDLPVARRSPVSGPLLEATDVAKHFRMGQEDIQVLRSIHLKVEPGEWVSIIGASGSGKSTLLHLLAALDRPDRGTLKVEGRSIFDLGAGDLNRYRVEKVGIVFQAYHLLPELSALENAMISGMMRRRADRGEGTLRDRATALLDQLGLGHRLRHRPNKLSGGERQRVAIARALINRPVLLLADEPTGNLDQRTGQHILELFQRIHQSGQSIIMVTHEPGIAAMADRCLQLDDSGLSPAKV